MTIPPCAFWTCGDRAVPPLPRWILNAKALSPPTSWLMHKSIQWRCTSRAGGMPEKTWPPCCASGARTWIRLSRCATRSPATSAQFKTLVAHCLSHGRREFVSVAEDFPEPCRQVLECLGEVYRVDAQAKELAMSPEHRLVHHQTHSHPVMEK